MSADSVEQHYVDGFTANLSMVPQQKEARLVSCVDSDLAYSKKGKMFNGDDIDDDDDEVEVVSRAPDSPESFANHVRRVGFFKSFAKGRFIEDLDTVRQLVDPANTIMAGMMATKKRATDDNIIAGFFADAREGETGGTTVAFPAAQIIAADSRANLHASESSVVAASGDLPLTIGKLITAGILLDASELEGERYFAWGSKEKGQLLSSTAATSGDYNAVKALVNGETNTFMGFTFVRSERLAVASSIRACAAWVKPAMVYKERPIQNAWIDRRKDKSGRWYAYYEVERGVMRRYDTGVVKVLCKET